MMGAWRSNRRRVVPGVAADPWRNTTAQPVGAQIDAISEGAIGTTLDAEMQERAF
jgi:hypothetical protein